MYYRGLVLGFGLLALGGCATAEDGFSEYEPCEGSDQFDRINVHVNDYGAEEYVVTVIESTPTDVRIRVDARGQRHYDSATRTIPVEFGEPLNGRAVIDDTSGEEVGCITVG